MELNIDPIATSRMFLVYLHLLAIAGAAVAVAFGDYAIFAREHIDNAMLRKAAIFATLALGVLWVTGLSIIVLDLGVDLDALAAKPKLLAKLTVVSVLTINSLALHFQAFPSFATPHADTMKAATMPAIFGAISAASWIFAAFIGVAKPLASALGYGGFMALYAAVLGGAIVVAMMIVRPRLASRLAPSSAMPVSGALPA